MLTKALLQTKRDILARDIAALRRLSGTSRVVPQLSASKARKAQL